jgi:glycosyltransferase involved in cell wall biosynthesis
MTNARLPLLDCRWLAAPAGAGRVTQHLLGGMRRLPRPDTDVLLWGSPDRLGGLPAWCRVAPTELVGKELGGQRQWLSVPAHERAVYLHQTRPLRDWRSATLVHDTIQLRAGAGASRRLKRAFLRTVVRRSQVVLTVSEHSRRSIIDELGCPPDRIRRLVLPVDRQLAGRVRERRALLDERGERVAGDVLWVGRVAPHKNVPGLLRAFAASGLDGPFRLHLFGPRAAEREGLLRAARSLGIEHVEIANSTTDADLVDAYARAAVVVVPSFEEGWGLPAYEAAACGIPVVASLAGALPEVAAHAAGPFGLVDVRAPRALATALAEAPLTVDLRQMDAWSDDVLRSGATEIELAQTVLDVVRSL